MATESTHTLYYVVCEPSLDKLILRVQGLLEIGWKLEGGIALENANEGKYCQAITHTIRINCQTKQEYSEMVKNYHSLELRLNPNRGCEAEVEMPFGDFFGKYKNYRA